MNMALLIAAAALRNPFWPIGYEGVREEISAEPSVDVKVSANAEDDTATAATAARSSQTVSDQHWAEALKTLRIGGTAVGTNPDGTKRHCIIINNLAYGDGDLISINHGNKRFTWRVVGLTKGETIRLNRIRAITHPDTPGQKNQKETAK